MSKQIKTNSKRDLWRSNLGFILACIGSAVGMGNIWLFPARVANYGGSFLLTYFIFVALIGFTGVIGEMGLGRRAKSGPVGAFEKAMAHKKSSLKGWGKALGQIPMVGSLLLALGYTVVMGWIFKYLFGSLTGSALSYGLHIGQVDGYGAAFGETASAFGNNTWLIVALLVTFLIMVAGVSGGIEKANKVMIPLFYLLFIGLAVYISTQPGAANGYRWMFTIDPKIISDPMCWVYALGQAFFSLSLAGSGTVIYGSYLDDREDIVKSAAYVSIFDTLAALLAALVIIPAMAIAGVTQFQGGPGLMFIYLPNLFASMQGGQIICIVFFSAVLFAGLTSLVNLYETPVSNIQDAFGKTRKFSVATVGTIGLVVALCIQGIVGQWMDFVSIYICPLGAGLAAVMFAWFWGKEAFEDELSKGRKNGIAKSYYPLYKYVFCGLTILVFILGIIKGGIG